LKKKNVFLFEFGFWAESSSRPRRPPRTRAASAAQPAGAVAQRFAVVHPRSEAEADPLSESDPIEPDLARDGANLT
jgi:hypothetical protein